MAQVKVQPHGVARVRGTLVKLGSGAMVSQVPGTIDTLDRSFSLHSAWSVERIPIGVVTAHEADLLT